MSNTRPDVLLFDVGNTLLYVDHPFIRASCAGRGNATTDDEIIAAEYIARAEMEERLRAGEPSTDAVRWERYFRTILDRIGVGEDEIGIVMEEIRMRHARLNMWSRLLDGTAAMLERLRGEGYRLGVISNANGSIRGLLEHLGIARYFEVIIDSGEVGVEKPDPRIFELACEALDVPPERCLYIGDFYELDVLGARRVGMPAVLIDPLDSCIDRTCPRIRALLDLPAFLETTYGAR